jgi:hypothetical protein
MPAAKYAFAFISMVLFGSAIATYFRPWDDQASIAVPIFFAVCGLITAAIAANVERLLGRQSKSFDGEEVRDISMPRQSTNQNSVDLDCDD